ncbi:AGAP000855-PA [Anopheles gambiae str. PEST]|uniref:SREBP regulating gene protein n=3 Tax=gambiae species complex TaxID=44542 RepID=Q7Q4V7_ANOGA|nr:SREBP regulating gene protein [Anopheles coluzzii]XP_316825.5 SREBP regulating gene protein isoform X2 [Anopheles gambiae]EAA12112.5 AGAP000855-PA [Anopheles gambiae str. PEST]
MCYVVIAKFIRRRLVLAIIFLLSLSYCMVHLIRKSNNLSLNGDYLQTQLLLRKNIIWTKVRHTGQPGALGAEVLPAGTANETDDQPAQPASCRNSIQGRSLLVDDRGYVCPRADLLANGCCSAGSGGTTANADAGRLFPCRTCLPNRCCAVYEYCVACCLNPDKRPILEEVLAKANGRQVALYAEVTDQFELCLTKCRTNSQSVQNENKYRNPEQKHCYGEMSEAAWASASGKDAQKPLPDDP